MALKVFLPNNNHFERRYLIEVLLRAFLGLNFDVNFGENSHLILELENGTKLILEDHFFNQFPEEVSYQDKQNIPQQVILQKKSSNPFMPENDLPVIFGNTKMEISDYEIICGIDVLASAFFMLTRWEEFVCKERDSFGRFPANASLAGRAGFLHRPVVNEYVEMLWNMLSYLGIRQKRKTQEFRLLPTHDVDYPMLWTSPIFFLKKLGGDLVRRRSIQEAMFSIKSYTRLVTGAASDPYNKFSYLMECAERYGLQSHFFFLAGGITSKDYPYNLHQPFIQSLFKIISERGHHVGFHPSFDACTDGQMFRQELERLRAATSLPIASGRQHFLRFEIPKTWQIWDDNHMDWECTLGYPERSGFRCGVCLPYPVFNILSRQMLNLIEIPLTAMDATYANYQKKTRQETTEDIFGLIKTVKKYKGTFVLLWHNSSFEGPMYEPYTGLYEQILSEASHVA